VKRVGLNWMGVYWVGLKAVQRVGLKAAKMAAQRAG
jgi:hypothetical protein